MFSKKMSLHNLINLMILLLFLSLLIGIVAANCFFADYLEQMQSIIDLYIKHYYSVIINKEELLIYLIKVRFLVLVFLCILGNTKWSDIAMGSYCLWIGFSAGIFVAMVTIQKGLSGFILVFMSLLPQYLVYIPAFVILFFEIIHRRKILDNEEDSFHEKTRYICVCVVVMVLFLIGIWLEAYVNPIFTKKLLTNYYNM